MSAGKNPLYRQVARRLSQLIRQGVYPSGERVPSIRQLSRSLDVSLTTVTLAYRYLQQVGQLHARPQSGYYVAQSLVDPQADTAAISLPEDCRQVRFHEIADRLIAETHDPRLDHLGEAIPDQSVRTVTEFLNLVAGHARRLARYSRTHGGWLAEPHPHRLRQVICRRLFAAGCPTDPTRFVATRGYTDGLALAIRSLCGPGAVVGIERPCAPSVIRSVTSAGCLPMPLRCDPETGLDPVATVRSLEQVRLDCLITTPSFSNPTGALMPLEVRRGLVDLLGERGVPIIELDLFSDLAHQGAPLPSLKSLDRWDNVTLCASYDMTLTPGAGLGYLIRSRHGRAGAPQQDTAWVYNRIIHAAFADFLSTGGYDRHLRLIRRLYAHHVPAMAALLLEHLPAGTRIQVPKGGFLLWAELPSTIDALCLHHQARKNGLVVAPGQMFTHVPGHNSHLRISAAVWSQRVREAVARLGWLAARTRCSNSTAYHEDPEAMDEA